MSLALARRFKVDLSTDNTTWLPLRGINDLAPTENPTMPSADTYDTDGFNAFEKTMTGWKVIAKALRPTTAGIPSDAGQALAEATRFQFGDSARLYVRWYDRNGGTEAFSGRAIVDWNQSKTSVPDLDEVTITLNGDGPVARISNPYASAAVPVITSALPTAVAVGGQVSITGSGFIGAVATTGVKFGGVNATSWIVVSDSLIVAVMPAGSAGSAVVLVTNAAGASTSFPYTRGA